MTCFLGWACTWWWSDCRLRTAFGDWGSRCLAWLSLLEMKDIQKRQRNAGATSPSQSSEEASALFGFLIDNAAAYYGAQDFRLDVLGRRDFRQVIREDDEVGVLACFQGAFLRFFELGVGRADGVGADAVVQGDFLLGLPAAGGAAFGELAGDAGVEAAHGVDGLDVVVGAEGQVDSVFEHGGPGV